MKKARGGAGTNGRSQKVKAKQGPRSLNKKRNTEPLRTAKWEKEEGRGGPEKKIEKTGGGPKALKKD